MSFEDSLREGKLGEGLIATWLKRQGYNVLPAYEIEQAHGKGPQLFMANGSDIIAPDLLIFNSKRVLWVEAKTKTAFTWYRINADRGCQEDEIWQTGIDRRHWRHYIKVAAETPWPVWLLFLHRPGSCAKDTPVGKISPAGLFGGNIKALMETIDHESEKHGPSGMVYWCIGSLRVLEEWGKFASIAGVEE